MVYSQEAGKMHIKVKVVLKCTHKLVLYSHTQRVRTAILTMDGMVTYTRTIEMKSHTFSGSASSLWGNIGPQIQRPCTGCKEKNSSIDVPSCGQDWKQPECHESKW